MNKLYIITLCFLLGVTFSFATNNEAIAAKKNKPESTNTIKALSNDGETTLYGSVLNPNDDEVIIPLSKKNLTNIRNIGLNNISISLTSTLDSTKTYSVADDAFSIQRKKINNKNRKSLIVSLFNLTTQSGVIISPSALPASSYKLRITGNGLDITTDAINYETPSLIVGRVDSETTGIVSVEDLKGNIISERTVVTSPDGTFFTEVRANKLSNTTKVRRYLRAQIIEGEETGEIIGEEEIDTGVVHCATNIDQYAIVSLKNDAEKNTERTNDPVEVNETSTLTANLAKENEELAAEIASSSDISSSTDDTGEEDDFDFTSGPGCDIEQFANRCNERSGNNDELFASIGVDFREFLKTATCRFPEFKLIKLIILAAPDEINVHIGRGYCEHARREVNDDKPCLIYERILTEYKKGFISELPCPPYHCERFSEIRPPQCIEPIHVCGDPKIFNGDPCHSDDPNFNGFTGPNGECITEPVGDGFDDILARSPQDDRCIRHEKDLYCKRIGIDIDASECQDVKTFDNRFRPGWVVVKNSKGNEYCVPSNIPKPQFPAGFNGPFPPTTPEEIAEECELHECHKSCEEELGFPVPPPIIDFPSDRPGEFPEPTSNSAFFSHPDFIEHSCPVCDCHFACDAESGRARDCGNPRSKYFHIDCCNSRSISFETNLSGLSSSSAIRPGYPISHDQYSCVCEDKSNFNEKGYLKEDVIDSCENNCPEGYEKDPNTESCLAICPEGSFRDPGGICRSKCPKGSFSNEFGQCQCPPGLEFSKGQCIPTKCPEHCKNIPLVRKLLASHDGTGFGSPSGGYGNNGFTTSIPPECKACFGIQNSCPDNQYRDGNGVCKCNSDGRTPGPEGCKQGNICGNSNMLPNPKANEPNQAQCICPSGLPYWDPIANNCVAVCSQGQTPGSSSNLPQNSPIPCQGGGGSKCQPAAPYLYNGTCVATCPANTSPQTYNYGTNPRFNHDGSFTSTGAGQLECLCYDGARPGANGNCGGTQNNYCPPAIKVGTDGCTCNPTGGGYNDPSTNFCQCPSGSNSTYTKVYGCTSVNSCPPATPYKCPDGTCVTNSANCTGSNYCAGATQVGTAGCTCNPTGGAYNSNGYCICPSGSSQAYTKEYGCGSSARPCTAGEGPSNGCYCFGSGFTGADGKCQCSGGIQYTGGGCGTSTNYCAPAISTTTGCTCAPGATPSGEHSTCHCTNGGAYSSAGCGTDSSNYCSPGIAVGTASCTCNPSGGGFSSNGFCGCPSGSTIAYTKETGCTSSSRTCAPGEVPTAANPCTCASGGFFNSSNTCTCTTGTYTAAGCGTSTTHTCALGEVSTSSNPCTCATGATVGSNGQCQCTNGQVYASGGCPTTTCTGGKIFDPAPSVNACRCPNNQVDNGSGSCVCPAGRIPNPNNPQGDCICPEGQENDPANPALLCRQTCKSEQTRDSAGICQCPVGRQNDPASSTGCSTCPACTGGKVFGTSGCGCVCPSGTTEDSNGNCV